MPDRITHIKRFTNGKAWVDVERIDQLVRTSGQGPTFTRTIQNIFWMDEGKDSDNPSRKMHTLTVSNPHGPESVDVLVIDRCTFLVDSGLPNIVRKFRNREDDNNDGRKTTSVRITSSDDTSQYVDVEVVDKFYDHDNDGRVQFRMRNQGLEKNANGPGGPPINPPYRLDPYQNIVGVSWGKKDHPHHDTPSSGDDAYMWFEIRTEWIQDWSAPIESHIVWVHRIHSSTQGPVSGTGDLPLFLEKDYIFPPPFHPPESSEDPGYPPNGATQGYTMVLNYSDGARIAYGQPITEVYQ